MKRVTISFSWPWSPAETRELLSFAFQVSLITYLAFYLVENLFPSLISYSVDLNAILWVTIGLGVVTAIWPTVNPPVERTDVKSWRMWLLTAILSVGGGLIVWHEVGNLHGLGIIIAILSGLIIGGISLALYFEEDEPGSTGEK